MLKWKNLSFEMSKYNSYLQFVARTRACGDCTQSRGVQNLINIASFKLAFEAIDGLTRC